MTMFQQEYTKYGLPSMKPYLKYLLDQEHAEHKQLQWGKGERWVFQIEGNKYPYKKITSL